MLTLPGVLTVALTGHSSCVDAGTHALLFSSDLPPLSESPSASKVNVRAHRGGCVIGIGKFHVHSNSVLPDTDGVKPGSDRWPRGLSAAGNVSGLSTDTRMFRRYRSVFYHRFTYGFVLVHPTKWY